MTMSASVPQVLVNEDKITDIQAELEGPGELCAQWRSAAACHLLLPTLANVMHPVGVCNVQSPKQHAQARVICCAAAGTPYEGGLFRMKLVLGEDFPTAPPKGE